MKIYTIFFVGAFFINECTIANLQNLQLSYANADIGEKLIRSATTTTPVPTTKKSSFFGGIRNLFSRKDSTTQSAVPAVLDSLALSTTTLRYPAMTPKNDGSHLDPTSTILYTQSTTTKQPLHNFESFATITLSTKAPRVKEDFPALPTLRTTTPVRVVQPTTSLNNNPTVPNAWFITSTTEKSSMVNFVPREPISNGISVTPGLNLVTSTVSPVSATDYELETLSESLFNKESNIAPLVSVNYQGRTQSSAITDEAPEPLLTVNEASLNALDTVAKLRLLYNNYELDTTVNEHVTALERTEENDFIDNLLSTGLMRHAMSFLQQKGKVTLDPKTHRDLLKTIWFSLYSRGRGRIGSSAFEHVFLTELRNGTVSGFHNWIYYFFEEQAGRADYKGWLKKVNLGTKGSILKYRFSYNGTMKPVNAMFVGTSPELEIALYTICFALRADTECPVALGGQKFIIRTHTFRYRGKSLIGSAFPEI